MTDVFSNLPAHLADKARKIVASRELDGRNVHFTNERGEADRFSFATKERADKFRANVSKTR
jgi:hypothetical protein